MLHAHLCRLGEAAWLVSFEPQLAADVNDRVLAVAAAARAGLGARIRDIVPAAASLAVHFDPALVDGTEVHDVLVGCLSVAAATRRSRLVEIPVCYDLAMGPDLSRVAEFARCTIEEVVRRHAAPRYRVFMLGFLPGFPYLGLVDVSIAMPRRPAPRPAVPAGSVAIAGRQTGVYPSESPGGWQIVGRTPLRLFTPGAEPPALLRPGDEVQFVPIDRASFHSLARES